MFSLLKRWYERHFSQPGTIEFALVLIVAFITVYYFMWLVGPIIVALCFAFCLDWPVVAMQNRFALSRKIGSIIVMVLFSSLMVFITILIVPNVIKQGAEFYNSIVAFSTDNAAHKHKNINDIELTATSKKNSDLTENQCPSTDNKEKTTIVYIGNNNNSQEQMAKAVASAAKVAAQMDEENNSSNDEGYHITLIDGTGNNFNLNGDGQFTLTAKDFDMRLAQEIHDVVQSTPDPLPSMLTLSLIEKSVRSARIAATNKMADVMRTQLMPSVVNAFTWLVYAIIVPIFTFLMLYNKEQLKMRAKIFILPNNQQLIRQFWPSMHSQIAGYIRGKLLHIIIIAIANTLAFMLLGMNYALLLGVGVGLSVVIPYVGAVIIAVPVVMIAIFQFGFTGTLVWVLAVYTLIQLLDSNVLTPMLFSKAMNLDAFSILAAILIFGNLWGFWGVFFAIPLATFVKTLIVGWPNAEPQKLEVLDEKHNPRI